MSLSERKKKSAKTSMPYMVLFCAVTGVVCGIIISLFIICARIAISETFGFYKTCNTPLAIVCAITLVLLGCLITAVIQTLCPAAKGSGIPLAEGAARGMLGVKWLRTAAALIAGSLTAFICGMPLGSEGPSIGVGGLIGEGVGKMAKRPVEFRRYLITGGSSAGLAIAFNAPLAGIAFALEETHRRFSPRILIAACATVIFGVLTSQALFYGFGQIAYLNALGIHAGFAALHFMIQTPTSAAHYFIICGIAFACGAATALFAVAFNRAIFALNKLFDKIHSVTLRLLPAFLLPLIAGLSLYLSVGSGEAMLAAVYEHAELWLLFVLLFVRFVITCVASGARATGGLFIPMMAVGGLIGVIISKLTAYCGLDASYAPNIIMICIAAFFAASTHAPISAAFLSLELTASFTNLLPCAIAVGIALAVALATKTEPLYERMMEDLQRSAPVPQGSRDIAVKGVIPESSGICGIRIRNILWPYNSLVTELVRDGVHIVPDGETTLLAGDILTVHAENIVPDSFMKQIREYIDPDENYDDSEQNAAENGQKPRI